MTYELGPTGVRTTAAEAWSLQRGVCQDMAHVMIAMCRTQGIAARYVSGHLLGEGASHAWVEARDPCTGRTVAYDPTHARQADLRYVTVAVGRDYRDVAPTAGSYLGGPPGRLSVRKQVAITSVA
jgi:transglutaminase-like putative cysteine protease